MRYKFDRASSIKSTNAQLMMHCCDNWRSQSHLVVLFSWANQILVDQHGFYISFSVRDEWKNKLFIFLQNSWINIGLTSFAFVYALILRFCTKCQADASKKDIKCCNNNRRKKKKTPRKCCTNLHTHPHIGIIQIRFKEIFSTKIFNAR